MSTTTKPDKPREEDAQDKITSPGLMISYCDNCESIHPIQGRCKPTDEKNK